MPCAWPVTDDMKNPAHYPLAKTQACYAGDGVACVLADSATAARDALEAINVQYEPLEAVIDLEDALSDRVVDPRRSRHQHELHLEPVGRGPRGCRRRGVRGGRPHGQRALHPAATDPDGDGATGRAGDAATVRRRHDAVLGHPGPPHPEGDGRRSRSASPSTRCASSHPPSAAAFGSKLNVYAEELLCVALARKHGVPVRWNEDRSENAMATIHGRGQIQKIELAADADGKLTAIRVRLLADMGAYLQLVTPGIPLLGAFLYAGRLRPAEGVRLLVHVGVHHDDAHRRLPRRRTPRGHVRDRAGDGFLGRQDRRRPARAASPQLHRHRQVSVRGVQRADVRLGRPRRRGDEGRRDARLRRAAGPAGHAERRGLDEASRHRCHVVLRDVRAGAVTGAGLAQLLGRRLGGRHGAGAADLQGAGRHRQRRRTARATRRRGR